MMDRMGTMKPIAYSFQTLWGTTTQPPATGTTATKIVLTPDHTSLLTDPNDIVYVKATIADATNRVVTSAANPVTFSVTGPGTIVAVDSGSVNAESFRGNQRMAYQGLAFALIQATGPGAITVTTAGLTGDGDDQCDGGDIRPCSGTCDELASARVRDKLEQRHAALTTLSQGRTGPDARLARSPSPTLSRDGRGDRRIRGSLRDDQDATPARARVARRSRRRRNPRIAAERCRRRRTHRTCSSGPHWP